MQEYDSLLRPLRAFLNVIKTTMDFLPVDVVFDTSSKTINHCYARNKLTGHFWSTILISIILVPVNTTTMTILTLCVRLALDAGAFI